MNTTVAVAEIASRTLLWLAIIGAGVRLAPGVLPRLQISNPRGQARSSAPPAPSAGVPALDGQAAREEP